MNRQTGFSLIEIMIALLLGLVVVGGAITMYIATIRGSTDTLRSARLNHDLDSSMQLMINDIRRAGYWGGAIAGSDAEDNPFTAAATNIQIMDFTDADGVAHASGCILYTYDGGSGGNDGNGIVDGNEYYGFRLDRNAVWMRMTGTTTADCTDGNWERITDESQLSATALTFSDAPSQCQNTTTDTVYAKSCNSAVADGDVGAGEQAVETRQIDIVMTGTVLADNTVTKTLSETVKVRNNRIFTE